jgi:hypothetical protein
MTASGKSGDPKGGLRSAGQMRAERLAAALRDNLKRRKAQAKARARAAKGHDSAGFTDEIAKAKPKG